MKWVCWFGQSRQKSQKDLRYIKDLSISRNKTNKCSDSSVGKAYNERHAYMPNWLVCHKAATSHDKCQRPLSDEQHLQGQGRTVNKVTPRIIIHNQPTLQ
eukprot:1824786-Amphidinium_carterae.1